MTIKNQKGLTLVEMLAVIVLLAVAFSGVYYIISSAIKQQSVQTKEVEQIQNGAYLLKQITKDLRKSLDYSDEIPGDTEETITAVYTFLGQNDVAQYKYEYDGNLLYRTDLTKDNTRALIGRNVKDFSIAPDPNDATQIKVYFKLNDETFETKIIFRKGG